MQLYRGITSPAGHKHIVLPGLSPEAIQLTMQQTEVFSNVSIKDYLNIEEKLLTKFCEILHIRSGGLPRTVHYALEG